MRLAHLFESDLNLHTFDTSHVKEPELVQQIKSECADVLARLPTNRVLFRGIKGANKTGIPVQHYETRPDRKPRDSDASIHKLIVDWQKGAGWPVRRDYSYFAAGGRLDNIGEFGDRGIILPIGKLGTDWHYAWSRDATDRVYYEIGDVRSAMFPHRMSEYYLEKNYWDLIQKMEWILNLYIGDKQPTPLDPGVEKLYKIVLDQRKEFDGYSPKSMFAEPLIRLLKRWRGFAVETYTHFENVIKDSNYANNLSMTKTLFDKSIQGIDAQLVALDTFIKLEPDEALEKLGWIWNESTEDFRKAVYSGHEMMLNGSYYWFDLMSAEGRAYITAVIGTVYFNDEDASHIKDMM